MSILLKIFRRPDYNSDATELIEGLKTQKPDLDARQRAGMSIFWDKNVDREAWNDWRKATVPQKPYVYQTDAK
jgi:hypothetical protein